MSQFIFTMKGLGKIYPPDSVVFQDIWLSFLYGAKIGVIGSNGSGKSTLLRIMAGLDLDFQGEARLSQGFTVGLLAQEPELDATKNVLGNVEEGVAPIRELLTKFDDVNAKFGESMSDEDMDKLMAEQARLQDAIEAAGAWDLDSKLEHAMDALRLPPGDADVTNLSGGERRRVALCRLLLKSPDLLLLDEPTNHLDAESVAWLEHFLKEYKGSVVAITHDRYFLDNVANWILELDRTRAYPWEGNYSGWLDQKQQRLALEEKSESKRQRTLQRELEWIRMSPRAPPGEGQSPTQRLRAAARRGHGRSAGPRRDLHSAGSRLGDVVVEARGLRKGYGDQLLIEGLDFTLPRGGIVGVIGPNGAGKTTLFRMLVGQETPDAGTLKVGETVQIGYVDQSRAALKADKTVWEEISGGEDEIVSAAARSIPARTSRGSTSRGATSNRRSERCLAVSAIVCTWRSCCRRVATCCSSTSRRTTSTSTRCARWNRRCSISPAAPSSSRTIAGFSTASRRTCCRSRATVTSNGSRAISRTMRWTRSGAWAPTPTSRIASNTGS
jgi:ATP-binding cassette ChvD family protein